MKMYQKKGILGTFWYQDKGTRKKAALVYKD